MRRIVRGNSKDPGVSQETVRKIQWGIVGAWASDGEGQYQTQRKDFIQKANGVQISP